MGSLKCVRGTPKYFFNKTQKAFTYGCSYCFSFLCNASPIPHLRLQAGLLYLLLPESSDILTKCVILPIPDLIYILTYLLLLDFNILLPLNFFFHISRNFCLITVFVIHIWVFCKIAIFFGRLINSSQRTFKKCMNC